MNFKNFQSKTQYSTSLWLYSKAILNMKPETSAEQLELFLLLKMNRNFQSQLRTDKQRNKL
jgi:hypothetical protein